MHHCNAGARALDTLCTGLMRTSLRQQRAQRFFQQCRTFGSQPSVQQLESVVVAPTDNTFVPFHDIQHQLPPDIIYPGKNRRKREKRLLKEKKQAGNDGEDWHAEIEVVAPTVDFRQSTSAQHVSPVLDPGVRLDLEDTADNVALPRLHMPTEQSVPEFYAPSMLNVVLTSEISNPGTPVEIVVASAGERKAGLRTPRRQRGAVGTSVDKNRARRGMNGQAVVARAEKSKTRPRAHGTRRKAVLAMIENRQTGSRTDRKERRVEAGTYRASAAARVKNEAVEQQVQTVLYKLDEEVDGPKQARVKAMERLERFKNTGVKKTDRAAADKGWDGEAKPKKEVWQIQKRALENKFGETGWQPRKRLSPDTLEGIRALHASDPSAYSTETLSEHFRVAPEAIRRILKSKWRPDDEETEDRKNRWERRGVAKWQDMAEQGARPPAKWRAMGVGSEEGPNEEKVPKRRKKKRDDGHLSWDDVVGGEQLEAEGELEGGFAERLL
ncbi:hypothetical protein LTR08_000397 [Meristemomyces frigidus]|nr:hypothetical protein LTR08_000397 [Meristemomyces frigidus]